MHGGALLNLFEGILCFAFAFLIFYSTRRRIIGQQGVVIEGSNPYAIIRLNGQKWRAIAEDGSSLSEGDAVVVLGIKGLQLAVASRVG
jgi:membrane protein implicated in regulation of membrane protease activity